MKYSWDFMSILSFLSGPHTLTEYALAVTFALFIILIAVTFYNNSQE